MVSSLSPISSTALAPVSGYEPWVMRSTSSVKEAIADGNPVLMRVHCAADYPMEDELKRALSSPANNVQEFRNLEAIGNSVMEKERESISIPHLSKSRQI